MSESADVVKEGSGEFFKGLAGRFAGPCAAYITTSWLAYNWSNIVFLFMSKNPVEKRIAAIYAEDDLYYNYLFLPIVTGIILSIAMPGLNALISNFTSYFKAKIHYADEKAIDKEEIAKKGREYKKQAIDAKMDLLEANKNTLTTEISTLQATYDDLKKNTYDERVKIFSLTLRVMRFINDYSIYFEDQDDIDHRTIQAKDIFNLFTEQERKNADVWLIKMRRVLDEESLNEGIITMSLKEFTSIDKLEEILAEIMKNRSNHPQEKPSTTEGIIKATGI